MFSEIDQIVLQRLEEHVAVEDVNSHRSLEQFFIFVGTDGADQLPAHLHFLQDCIIARLLDETRDSAINITLHDAKLRNLMQRYGFGGQGDVCAKPDVLMQQRTKIHPVKLVAAWDREII